MNEKSKLFAFIFPGQGSQKVGMGKELYKEHKVAREVFQEVDDTLKFNLKDIIFDGPENTLTQTTYAQPALMTVSIALTRVLEYELNSKIEDIASIVCGHSLGEYSALCSIDSISIADTARLLRTRGYSMQKAVNNIDTKMTAVIGMKLDVVENIIKNNVSNEICEIANDNCPGQLVISGHKKSVEKVANICKNEGAKMVVDLKVSAPFHCKLMEKVEKDMEKALNYVKISNPKSKFIANVNAQFENETQKIKSLLIKQVSNRVRWRESINLIFNSGIKNIIEIGSGKVLSGLNKRMGIDIKINNINNLENLNMFLELNFKK